MAVGMPKSTNILITSTKKKGPLANENLNNNSTEALTWVEVGYLMKAKDYIHLF